jgi:predicted SprT family Zn-dependent metalloprotease
MADDRVVSLAAQQYHRDRMLYSCGNCGSHFFKLVRYTDQGRPILECAACEAETDHVVDGDDRDG